MWLGLTTSRIEGDAAGKFTQSLESEALIERVLAIHELERLTGKDLGFPAEEGGRSSAQTWIRELSNGRIPVLQTPR